MCSPEILGQLAEVTSDDINKNPCRVIGLLVRLVDPAYEGLLIGGRRTGNYDKPSFYFGRVIMPPLTHHLRESFNINRPFCDTLRTFLPEPIVPLSQKRKSRHLSSVDSNRTLSLRQMEAALCPLQGPCHEIVCSYAGDPAIFMVQSVGPQTLLTYPVKCENKYRLPIQPKAMLALAIYQAVRDAIPRQARRKLEPLRAA
jgi:hypothetical protein